MNYDEFKQSFLAALRESGLPTLGPPPHAETLDLDSTERKVVVYVEPLARDIGGQFHVSASISWRWGPLLAARTRFREEDLLSEVLGRDEVLGLDTEAPVVRVDISLRAALLPGRELPMPAASTWAKWSKEAIARLDRVEPLIPEDAVEELSNGGLAILAWQGDPEVKAICSSAGVLKLSSIAVAAFQLIAVPRNWDDPEREPDPHPHGQLQALLARVKAALYAWGEVMDHFR